MSKRGILIIGAGGVGRVVVHKCAMNIDTFEKITLASRTLSKCKQLAKEVKDSLNVDIDIKSVDANNIDQLVELLQETSVKLVINVALPYQDLDIMDALNGHLENIAKDFEIKFEGSRILKEMIKNS